MTEFRKEVAEWLVASGYPWDWQTGSTRPPRELLLPLAEAWHETATVKDGTSRAEYLRAVRDLTGWLEPRAARMPEAALPPGCVIDEEDER